MSRKRWEEKENPDKEKDKGKKNRGKAAK